MRGCFKILLFSYKKKRRNIEKGTLTKNDPDGMTNRRVNSKVNSTGNKNFVDLECLECLDCFDKSINIIIIISSSSSSRNSSSSSSSSSSNSSSAKKGREKIWKSWKRWKKIKRLQRQKKRQHTTSRAKRQMPSRLEIILGELHPSTSHSVEVELQQTWGVGGDKSHPDTRDPHFSMI